MRRMPNGMSVDEWNRRAEEERLQYLNERKLPDPTGVEVLDPKKLSAADIALKQYCHRVMDALFDDKDEGKLPCTSYAAHREYIEIECARCFNGSLSSNFCAQRLMVYIKESGR